MEYWNAGILEYWGIKMDDDRIFDPCRPYKKELTPPKPSIPTFQYSNIPNR